MDFYQSMYYLVFQCNQSMILINRFCRLCYCATLPDLSFLKLIMFSRHLYMLQQLTDHKTIRILKYKGVYRVLRAWVELMKRKNLYCDSKEIPHPRFISQEVYLEIESDWQFWKRHCHQVLINFFFHLKLTMALNLLAKNSSLSSLNSIC